MPVSILIFTIEIEPKINIFIKKNPIEFSSYFLQVFFYIDPEFETDPRMDGINNIILSYTFFKVSEE